MQAGDKEAENDSKIHQNFAPKMVQNRTVIHLLFIGFINTGMITWYITPDKM